ncbi:MAG: class I SAM-dependent methyltransferase [Chloroflexi bacterium]|nr:class I SAM-dependent methyltransferase [Chloroflexota bacterium]MDA1297211.1 class I SAM-dependent methyltransferase [Chloroflexota bacterium]
MNYSEWADWYDLFYSTESGEEAAFYLEETLSAGGPVLEIGVGTGRIAIPAAKQGAEVFGVDSSPEMLAVAASKAKAAAPLPGGLTLIRADMRTLQLGRTDFALVTIPARTLLLATSYEEQQATLCCAARHLRPGGRLIFNIFNPTPELIFDNSPEPVEIGEAAIAGTETEHGRRFRLSAVNRFDAETQINDATHVVEEIGRDGVSIERARLNVRLRYLFPHEVFSMLEEIEVQVDALSGWFDGSPFDEESEEMVFVASRPG